jgi:hypothetical protein
MKEITQAPPKIEKRTRRGKKAATTEIRPSHETRKEPLEYPTIDNYIDKADILQRFCIKKALSQTLQAELIKQNF